MRPIGTGSATRGILGVLGVFTGEGGKGRAPYIFGWAAMQMCPQFLLVRK